MADTTWLTSTPMRSLHFYDEYARGSWILGEISKYGALKASGPLTPRGLELNKKKLLLRRK